MNYEIKRFSVWSVAKISFVLGAVFGFIFGMFAWMYLLAIPCAIYLILLRQHALLIVGFVYTFLTYLLLSRGFGIDFVSRYVYFQAFFAQAAVAGTGG